MRVGVRIGGDGYGALAAPRIQRAWHDARMPWRWLSERRRRHILEKPFPTAWEAIVQENVPFWRELDDEERRQMRDLVQVFVAEKHFEGCGGLVLTDEIIVTVATQACLLLLGRRDHDLFAEVDSILVYPHTVVPPERRLGVYEVARRPLQARAALSGEAIAGGPVILVWDDVKRGARDAHDGHNVVFHEMAHKIDMLDGPVDGAPPMRSAAEAKRWADVCAQTYALLNQHLDEGRPDFLSPYAAKNEAEFFAVATEAFFERGAAMKKALPELYAVLAEWYGQDPAARAARAAKRPSA
jgi:Mlc titration factor MtfA (ptsG expression regulator)